MDEGDADAEQPRPDRRRLAWLIGPIIALIVAANAGDLLTTTWSDTHPLWLILLNARNRVLILTTNQLDPVTYYVVGSLRLLISDPLFFLLGVWYGDAAVRWVEKRSASYGDLLRTFERLFGKASYPLVLIAPNNFICLFAGASGMPVGAFAVLNLIGTFGRLALIRALGEAFESPIDSVLDFFGRYRLELFVISVALVALQIALDRRKGKGEISSVRDLEHEIQADEGLDD